MPTNLEVVRTSLTKLSELLDGILETPDNEQAQTELHDRVFAGIETEQLLWGLDFIINVATRVKLLMELRLTLEKLGHSTKLSDMRRAKDGFPN